MDNSNALVKLSEARTALAMADSVPLVKEIRDRAEALRRYVKSSKAGLETFNQVAEVKLRAERKAGELLAEMERATKEDNLRRGSKSHSETSGRPQLAELGISKTQSHRWQLAATVPEEIFTEYLKAANQREDEVTSAALLELARNLRRRKGSDREPLVTDPVTSCYAGPNSRLLFNVAVPREIEAKQKRM